MTNYPTSLDTSTTIPAESASTPLSTNHVTAHQNIQDALEAIEAKVGIDASAVTSSHDYKLSEVTSTDKAVSKTATQTLTNKTLTAPIITSPKITVGSDAVGDLHYTSNVDGTQSRLGKGNDNQILKMNGSSLNWEDETVVVAATDSVQGIGILATAAQITAGTASESSYPLFVTPDQLALSTPVFNGSSLTNIVATKKIAINYTGTTIGATATETDILSETIAANTLGTGNGIRVRIFISTMAGGSNAGQNFIIRLKYGATTLATFTSGTIANIVGSGYLDCLLLATGATGTQEGSLGMNYLEGANGFKTAAAVGTSSEDSTASKTLAVSWDWATATGLGASSVVVDHYIVEKIS